MGLLTYTRRAFIGNGLVEVGDDLGTSLDEIRTSVNSISRAQLDTALAQLLVPTGSMTATACATAPSGWLLCDGTSYLRTDLPDLFTAIGTNYGSVDGTHFNVPDLRGRVPVGVDGAAGRLDALDALADTGGEQKHLLTGPESGIAQHSHGINGASTDFIVITGRGTGAGNLSVSGTTVNRDSNGLSIQNAGPTNAASQHNNMQPYQVVNWIIKT